MMGKEPQRDAAPPPRKDQCASLGRLRQLGLLGVWTHAPEEPVGTEVPLVATRASSLAQPETAGAASKTVSAAVRNSV